MTPVRVMINAYLYVRYGLHRITRTGPFAPGSATYVDRLTPVKGNPVKAALIRHYVKQFHASSCSVASVVSVVNAIRDGYPVSPEPITQMDILEKVRTGHWKERMSEKGYNGRRGLPLTLLGETVIASLDAYQIAYKSVEVIPASRQSKRSETIQQRLKQRLTDFEKKGNCLVLAHFDQGCFVQALNIPHISPVGGFDIKTGNVMILDVDPTEKSPYVVSFDTFYRGISSNYHHVFRPFGYQSGGCVVITLSGHTHP